MSIPDIHYCDHSFASFQRWEEKSKAYKRDAVIKVLAIAILVALGSVIFSVGMSLTWPLVPVSCYLMSATIGLNLLGAMLPGVLTSLLFPKILETPKYFDSYHTKKGAGKTCDKIRTKFATFPKFESQKFEFIGRIEDWVRYGFVTSEKREKLLDILKKEKSLIEENNSIRWQDPDKYRQNQEAIGILKKEWETIMEVNVIPDLPFQNNNL